MTPLEHTLLDLVTRDQLAELRAAAERGLAEAGGDDARLEVLIALATLRRFLSDRSDLDAAHILTEVIARGRLRLSAVQARESARLRGAGDRWTRFADASNPRGSVVAPAPSRVPAPFPADAIEVTRRVARPR